MSPLSPFSCDAHEVVHIHYRVFSSPLGDLYLVRSEQGVVMVTWPGKASRLLPRLSSMRGVVVEEDGAELEALYSELQAYLAGEREELVWPIDDRLMRGDLQQQVLRLISGIPRGAVMSYRGVAEALGRPQAVRAVAQALGKNPLAIVIPCHRIIGSDGSLTGYAGGLERKSTLLALEGIPLQTRGKKIYIDRQQMHVGWWNSRRYCRPDCPSLPQNPPGNTLLLSRQLDPARLGFTPCPVCHPESAS